MWSSRHPLNSGKYVDSADSKRTNCKDSPATEGLQRDRFCVKCRNWDRHLLPISSVIGHLGAKWMGSQSLFLLYFWDTFFILKASRKKINSVYRVLKITFLEHIYLANWQFNNKLLERWHVFIHEMIKWIFFFVLAIKLFSFHRLMCLSTGVHNVLTWVYLVLINFIFKIWGWNHGVPLNQFKYKRILNLELKFLFNVSKV